MQRIIERSNATGHRDLRRIIADWVTYFAFRKESRWATDLTTTTASAPLAREDFVVDLVSHAITAVQPSRLRVPETAAAATRASAWLVSLLNGITGATSNVINATPEERQRALGAAHNIVGTIVQSAYVNVMRRGDGNDDNPEGQLAPEDLARYYAVVVPILDAVLRFSQSEHAGGIAAATAHSLMELLGVLLPVAPTQVVETAAAVAAVARGAGYHFDSLAVREVVRLVETVLADYREQFMDGEPLAALLSLLDVFAEAGWPEATTLVWRLDEVFR